MTFKTVSQGLVTSAFRHFAGSARRNSIVSPRSWTHPILIGSFATDTKSCIMEEHLMSGERSLCLTSKEVLYMNVLNRIIVIVLLIILLVLIPVLIFSAMVMPDASVATAEQAVNSIQANLTLLNRIIFSVLVALIWVALVLFLWLEIRRSRAKAVQVQEMTVGEARVSISSIVQRLEYNIDGLQDVVSVHPSVKPKGSGVDVVVNLQTSPEIDIPMKTEEVVQLAREVIEDQMGLKLHHVSVEIKHAPYPEDEMR